MEKGTLQTNQLATNQGKTVDTNVYNISTNIYTQGTNVLVERSCFAYMFTNIGDVKAFVNGMVINPSATPLTAIGDSRSISAHKLDIFKGNITIQFENPTVGVNPKVEIVQLFYAESYIK